MRLCTQVPKLTMSALRYNIMRSIAGIATAFIGAGVPIGIYCLVKSIEDKLNTGNVLVRWGALYEWYVTTYLNALDAPH